MKTALTGIPTMEPGVIAELYTITLKSGAALYYTPADTDLLYRGQTYLAGAFNLERGTIKNTVGIEVDDVTVTVYANADDTLLGVSLPAFVNNGGFDGAWVKIERARQDYVVHLFEGLVSDASADRVQINLTISAGTLLLNTAMPRNVYSPGCIHTLFDTGCGQIKAAYAHNAAILSGSTFRALVCGLTQEDGYYDLGTVTFTSGANIGIERTVRHYTVGTIVLAYQLPHVPAIGDTFTAYPGCDKRLVTCDTKYANKPNYRGFPFMPVPEASI